MLADGHRTAAEDIEATISMLSGSQRASRLLIEGAWGAAFHWIAFGCETKHQKHQESHTRWGRCYARREKRPSPTNGSS